MNKNNIAQNNPETSLIEQFLYALDPGQLWEEVARQVQEMGGTIVMHESVKEILIGNNLVTGVISENKLTGE